MEKLQKALKKAREARDSAEGKAPASAPSAASVPAPTPAAPPPPVVPQTATPAAATSNFAASVAAAQSEAAPAAKPSIASGGRQPSSSRRRSRLEGLSDNVMEDFPAAWSALTPYVPNLDVLTKNRVMTLNAESAANPFDVLRTKVFLLMRQNGWKRVAITSPTASCGKTTMACNLGVGFSRQREIKSMLFDFDLRKPSVARLLGCKPEYGVIDLLNDEISAEKQMLRLRSNVALSMSRGSVSDPTQVLLSQATGDMFHVIEGQFDPDIMIFDLPPMLVTDDARAFLKNVDCALIVARAEQTKMSQLDVCEREVSEHTNVLGVVLNNCRHMADEEQYYGEYA